MSNSLKAFDVETTGLYPYQGDRIFAFCIGDEDGNVDIYRKSNKNFRKVLQDFFLDTSIEKVGHNIKFDLTMVLMEKIKIPEETIIHDTMLQSQILRNLAPFHSLDYLCWELGGISRDRDKEVKKLADAYGGYQNVPIHLMNQYQIDDAQRTMLLHKTFYPDILASDIVHKDYLNEIAMINTTIRLEEHGVYVDKKKCFELITWMENELDTVQDDVYELMGEFANLNSPNQLMRILYTIYEFPILKYTKTRLPSTDKEVLAQLREEHPHPIHDLILKQRSYTKGISIIKSYIELSGEDNILHPTFNTNGAEKTGRQSSENPNLQNVSKREALLTAFPVPSRECFRIHPGCILLFADYIGIEFRLIVSDCNEIEFIELINNNGDVHDLATQILMGNEYINEEDKIRKKVLRNAGKNCNFALPYGGGAKKLASIINMSVDEFIPRLQRYKDRWPNVANFSKSKQKEVKENGFVITPFGRKLSVPKDIPYAGANYYIQGTAAGVLKRAEVKVDNYLKTTWNDEIRLVLNIHDELVISYPRTLFKYKSQVMKEVSKIMCDMPEIKIKLDVEWKQSKTNWDSAKEIAA